jgi:ectoine hydroxylase-related dioxygenase (phytanoyl-CoA dioxygenase family)
MGETGARTVHYRVEGRELSLSFVGETAVGEDRVLLDTEDDLIKGTAFADRGYGLLPFLEPAGNALLRRELAAFLTDIIANYIEIDRETFRLVDYHRHVSAEQHAAIVEEVRHCFDVARFPIDMERLETRMSEICGVPLTVTMPSSGLRVFCLRVVRPFANDNNPPHRDVWLDRLKDAVNIYFPIVGSSALTSLPLVPGSHRWKESEIERTVAGAVVSGIKFTVPTVTGGAYPMNMIRPQPDENEVLVFSPYLIHGGARNLDREHTRVSLEVRFWRKK